MLRKLFERRMISALIIFFEIIGLILFSIYLSNYFIYFWAVTIMLDIIIVFRIINTNTISEYKAPWVCVVLILPLLGALMYLLFYKRHLAKREIKHLEKIKQNANLTFYDGISVEKLKKENIEAYLQAQLIKVQADACVYTNTEFKFYALGENMFENMLADLKAAKHFIFLEYFILASGVMWNEMLKILQEKVNEGVEVRVMYDDVGSMRTIPSNYDKQLRKMGIKCKIFSRITPRATTRHNNRSHRKIMVVDGKVAYTGGINIADEYINQKVRFGHWKDGGIRLYGYAVEALTKLFLLDWDLNTKTISDYQKYRITDFGDLKAQGFCVPYGDGPSPIYDTYVAKNVYLSMINTATKYVYISTPYLIVDSEIIDALSNAALKGVDVRIFTPHIPDKKIIHLMTRSSYNTLIANNVKIYEYREGFIHSKNVLCDDKFAVVGSINFDYRSLVHHFEDAVWMYNTDIIPEIKKDFESLTITSIAIVEPIRFNFIQRIIKSIVEFFAPLL